MEGADGTETQFLLDTNCTLLGIPRRTCCQQQAIVNGHIKQAASILRANVLFMVLDPFTVGLVCAQALKV